MIGDSHPLWHLLAAPFEGAGFALQSPWPDSYTQLLGWLSADGERHLTAIALELSLPYWLWGLLSLALVAALVLLHRRLGRWRDRAIVIALRSGALLVLLFCLLDPTLVISRATPAPSSVAVVLDDSASLQLGEGQGAESQATLFHPVTGRLTQSLGEEHRLDFYRLGGELRRASGAPDAAPAAPLTALGRGLTQLSEQLADTPPRAVVLVSDGVVTGEEEAALAAAIERWQRLGVAIHTVAVGSAQPPPDALLQRLQLPSQVLVGDSIDAVVVLRQRANEALQGTLVLEDERQRLAQKPITIPANGLLRTRLSFTLDRPGLHHLRARLLSAGGDAITANNERSALVRVEAGPRRLLYVEGEPRFEFKYLRRAVVDDPALRVTGLVRTADSRYYRLDVVDPDELAEGFPTTEEELFRYHGLILGSVSASFFSLEQQQLIEAFVGRRGGALLMLGGKNAFAEGGHGASALADLLPVVLEEPERGFQREVQVRPSPRGNSWPLLQQLEALKPLAELPPLTVVNPLYRLKPGAVAWLVGTQTPPLIVLAGQRYGRGSSWAFTPSNSWLWQMHVDIPLENRSHEQLWSGLLRELTAQVPTPITIEPAVSHAAPGEALRFTVAVRDWRYRLDGSATPQVELRRDDDQAEPGDAAQGLLLQPLGQGRYGLDWRPPAAGQYRLIVSVEDEVAASPLAALPERRAEAAVLVSSGAHEPFITQRNDALLQRLAEETGGQFFTPEGAEAELPQALLAQTQSVAVVEKRAIALLPLWLLLVLLLLAADWLFRRRRGWF